MRTRSSIARFIGVLIMAVLLAGCPAPPPTPRNGVVDLGPLGRYGAAGGPGSMYANIDHTHFEPEHRMYLGVTAYNTPDTFGSFFLERHSPAATPSRHPSASTIWAPTAGQPGSRSSGSSTTT